MVGKYLGVQKLYCLQSVVDTDKVCKFSMPFSMGTGLVPIIRKIAFSLPFSANKINALAEGDFLEYACSLSTRETWTGFGDTGEDCVIANYAEIHACWSATATTKSGSSWVGHHGLAEQYFPEGLAYPFDEIYIKTITKNAVGVEWSAARIYYTMEKMSANDILAAREEIS